MSGLRFSIFRGSHQSPIDRCIYLFLRAEQQRNEALINAEKLTVAFQQNKDIFSEKLKKVRASRPWCTAWFKYKGFLVNLVLMNASKLERFEYNGCFIFPSICSLLTLLCLGVEMTYAVTTAPSNLDLFFLSSVKMKED